MPSHSPSTRASLSRRSFLRLSVVLGSVTALLGQPVDRAVAETVVSHGTYPTVPLKFCVMSDIHVLAEELWAEGDAFTHAENSDRKMLRESASILKRALDKVVEAKPDVVIIPGDLTKDGEIACHRRVHELIAEARERLAAVGVKTSFLVINGNHDLNNHHGLDFTKTGPDGQAEFAERTSPLAFKELWADCGYADAVAVYDAGGTGNGSLSYVARPAKGLTVIAVDTCKYNEPDPDGTGIAQTTGGAVSPELLAWACDQARQARTAGDLVIAFQHHGVVPHFDDEPRIMAEYLADNYSDVAEAYADAGISAVFTGHMHANDIAKATVGENDLYDIETGSLVTFPSYMRTGSISYSLSGEEVVATLVADSEDLGAVSFAGCGLDGTSTPDLTAYGRERTLTVRSVQTMLSEWYVEPLLDKVGQEGLKAYIPTVAASIAGDGTLAGLSSGLWGMLTTMLRREMDA